LEKLFREKVSSNLFKKLDMKLYIFYQFSLNIGGVSMGAAEILAAMPRRQKLAGRLLIGFFALMLVFTLLSRGLGALMVTTVSTATYQSAKLTHTVTGEGVLSAAGEAAVSATAGIRIQQLYAEAGSRVSQGDPLAQLDIGGIRDQLQDGYLALEKLQLSRQLGALDADASPPDERAVTAAELALERAQADLETLENNSDSGMVAARLSLRNAREELRRLEEDGDATDAEIAAQRATLRACQVEVDAATQEYLDKLVTAQRGVEDAELHLDKALKDAEAFEEDREAARQKRELEDRIAEVDIEIQRRALTDLEALQAAGGLVSAPFDGIVQSVGAVTGSLTTGEALFVLNQSGEQSKFRANVEESDLKYVSRGDSADVTLTGLGQTVEGGVVDSITPARGDAPPEVTVLLPTGDLEPGLAGKIKLVKQSETYGMCVPVEALRQDTAGNFLLVVREKQGVTGAEPVARRVDITILERDDTRAAIDAPLAGEDLIITGSSRSVSVGDRVRGEDSL